MHRIGLLIFWEIIGLLMVLFGINLYWQYSTSGIMWMIIISERVAMAYLVAGGFAVALGYNIWRGNGIRLIRFYSIFCMVTFIILNLHQYIVNGYMEIWMTIFPLVFIVLFLWLSLFIVKRFEQSVMSIKGIYKCIPGREGLSISVLVSFIIFAPILVPYEIFRFLHKIPWLNEIMKSDF